MGDSILKNNAYVSHNNSVENLVLQKNKNTYCYAEDHATISDIFSQIDNLSIEYNNPNTYIFLSAGGNNILSHYVDQNNDPSNTSKIDSIFELYKNLVKSIQTRLPLANLVLLDIYYPTMQYTKYHPVIKEWNRKIHEYYTDTNNKIYNVLQISKHLTQQNDFSFGIEPSNDGGKKIAELIANNL